MPERTERHFGGKVAAFNEGYKHVQDIDYDIIASLDADITFGPDYFSFLLGKFAENPRLGIGGAPFREGNVSYDYRFSSVQHVSGACQMFRKECYEAIGGYTPIKGGGIDVVAVLTARMKGWETRTFPERHCVHHRPMGTGNHAGLMTSFKLGEKDYRLGRHPAWQVFRSFYQMTRKPFILGGGALLAGFLWSMVTRKERPVSNELIEFQRREQMNRLKKFLGLKSIRNDGVNPHRVAHATK
jgi:poly-beta-1,6-N-acetyl-D-glucosamine synthase